MQSQKFVVLSVACLNAMHRCVSDIPKPHPELKKKTQELDQMLREFGYCVGDSYVPNVENRMTSANLFNVSRELFLGFYEDIPMTDDMTNIYRLIVGVELVNEEPVVEPLTK